MSRKSSPPASENRVTTMLTYKQTVALDAEVRLQREEHGVNVTRSDVIRMALEAYLHARNPNPTP